MTAAEETRAACLAEISAETADWIAADLQARGTTLGTGAGGGPVQRIRRQATLHRADARRHRARARTDAG